MLIFFAISSTILLQVGLALFCFYRKLQIEATA